MTEFLQFAVLGLGIAAVYSLLASGIVVIYRGSGIVNFAHGAFALVGAIVFTELTTASGWPAVPAIIAATVAGMVMGVLMQYPIMATLRTAAPIARIIATLGVLIAIQAAATLHYGDIALLVPQFLPENSWKFLGVTFENDRLILYGIAVLVTFGIWLAQSRLRAGLATRASTESEVAIATLGWSPSRLATANWAIGGALAGLAGALVVPLTGLLVGDLVLLVVPALAAALLGRFDSVWGALAGATAIGIGQSLITRYVTQVGAGDALPFLVIIVVLVVSGRALPLRSHIYERLPRIGSGRVRPIPALLGTGFAVLCMLVIFNTTWLDAFTISLATAIILLSIVVLTGYAGQLSLAQYALAGVGAFVAGRLVSADSVSFLPAAIIGIAVAVPVGALFALPALRTRGVSLAVITLGLAVTVSSMVFNNSDWTGGFAGTTTGDPKLFGLDINSLTYPDRYGVVVVIAFVVCGLVVANLRRSAAGRRMIAIRSNERAAASLGVSVTGTKLYAFMVAAAIAAVGGILVAFQQSEIVYSNFSALQSIYAMAYAVIGGLGFVLGPILGSMFTDGGIGSLFNGLFSGINNYLILIGGIFVVLVLMANPDGIIPGNIELFHSLLARTGLDRRWAQLKRLMPRRPLAEPMLDEGPAEGADQARVAERTLDVKNLTVRFGRVTAVDDVDITVRPGEIVGLIGPNGAGKTTFIDAVTGFVKSEGRILVNDDDITRRPASGRVHAGLSRSWQSLELFEDVTVLENLLVASESVSRGWWGNIKCLLRPGRPRLGATARAVVTEFELRDDLQRLPGDLSYGRRRLVGIGRAVALNPSVLLLDEPAAGLGGRESEELGRLMRRLAESWGMGILLVEHDVDLVMSVCDRIVVLNFGKVVATGTPNEIRDDEAVQAAYLGPVEESEEIEQIQRLPMLRGDGA
jgi:ABC-type branched-subunit amino acid transport system ATPase component/ABC-type branched-subunit amino acid transport system permease subunit